MRKNPFDAAFGVMKHNALATEAAVSREYPPWLGGLLIGVFLVSGFSALVYEVVWTRQLSLAFGSTAVASSTCLAAYLGGLALGAYWFGRLAAAAGSPLRLYAWMEALIGVYGALSFLLLPALGPAQVYLSNLFSLPRWASGLLQFVLTGSALLVPTALMGGTLPVLIGAYNLHNSSLARRLSALYGANTTGAILGAAAAGLWLLPTWGQRKSLWLAAALNLTLSALAFAAARRTPRSAEGRLPPAARAPLAGQIPAGVAYFTAALTGFCTLHYEVLWVRSLEVVLGGSFKAFTLVVATFLLGLAAGVWAAGLILRRTSSAAVALSVAQTGVAVSVFFSITIFQQLPRWFLALHDRLGEQPGKFWLSQALLAGAVLILPAIFLGAILPLLLGALKITEPESRLVGRLYAVNTVGNLAGSALAVLVFIPAIGIQASLRIGALFNLYLAALVAICTQGARSELRRVAVAVAVVAGGLGIWLTPTWTSQTMTTGVFAAPNRYAVQTALQERRKREERVVFYKEGSTATVAVRAWGPNRWLIVDGRVEGGTTNATQALLGHAPFWAGRSMEEIFVIGMGTGNTAAGAALHPVRKIEVAELEPAVITASLWFRDINRNVIQNPRVRVFSEDARNLLANRPQGRYDAIISQPSHPWVAGASKLFTREFYLLARSRLTQHGVFVQWVQLYGLDELALLAFLNTFRQAFPETIVVRMPSATGELVLLGAMQPIRLHWEAIDAAFRSKTVAADLHRVGFPNPGSLLARLLLGPQEISTLAAKAPVNTDDNGFLECASLAAQYRDTTSSNLRLLRQSATDPWQHISHRLGPAERAKALQQMAATSLADRDLDRGLLYARQAVELDPDFSGLVLLGDLFYALGRFAEATAAWTRTLDLPGDRLIPISRLVAHYRKLPPSMRPPAYSRWLAALPPATLLQEPPTLTQEPESSSEGSLSIPLLPR